jgi:hypothetical protein
MTCLELSEKLKSFDVKAEAVGVIIANKQAYIDRNKDQIKHGTKPNGELIGKYAGGPNSWYSQIKEQMNSLPGRGNVDLEYTKQFRAGIYLEITGDDLIMGSKDSKALQLEGKYGKDSPFYGLDTDHQFSFNHDVFLPGFLAVIEQKTGLKAG